MFYRLITDEGKKKRFAYAIGVGDWPQIGVGRNF